MKVELPVNLLLPKIIGILQHKLYVFLQKKRCKRWTFEFTELVYFNATISQTDQCVYGLFTGRYSSYAATSCDLALTTKRTRATCAKRSVSIYQLADEYHLHFETDLFVGARSDLCLYDRGIVGGEIPFTRFTLNHEAHTFKGVFEPVPADQRQFRSAIYGVLIDADEKKFVRLTDHNQLRVYDNEQKKWLGFKQGHSGNDFTLDEHRMYHAGIGVTYDDDYTRFAIVSSPINLLAGDGIALLTYKRASRVDVFPHSFELRRPNLQFASRRSH
ncbi:hypothetical protein M3Y99_01770600 [Aphelenchoides fujianensis]|nr:hypothetical protein M3Y99_01770600 [Aphelenchoides fujianensis]